MINVDCPVCGSKSKKRTSRHYSDRSKMSYVVCLNKDCQCVFSTFEIFDRFIAKTIDPAHLPAPVEEPVKEGVRQKAPVYTVRLE